MVELDGESEAYQTDYNFGEILYVNTVNTTLNTVLFQT